MNIELFPCSGGMSEGHRRAGIEFDVAFDKDPNACASHEHNLQLRPIQLDVHDLVRMARGGWRPGPVDYLCADPPCTPWSRAGKRAGLADPRDCLRATAELIELLRPRAYLIGNVPGLQDSTSWHVVQEVIGGLARLGYCVVDYAALDAADYGVPQHRVRPFWFGHLDGPCIRWPAPTHGAPTEQLALGAHRLMPWVTCRAALQHLPLADLVRPVRIRWKPQDHRPTSPDEPAKALTTNTHSDGAPLKPRQRHPANTLDAPSYAVTTKGDGRGAQGACVLDVRPKRGDGSKRWHFSQSERVSDVDKPSPTVQAREDRKGRGAVTLDWPWDRPSTTIMGDERLSVPGHHDPNVPNSIHKGPNAVVLSEKAAGILQGSPESWLFSGDTKKARWSQIGQAMPPPLAHAVATAVAEQLAASRAKGAA